MNVLLISVRADHGGGPQHIARLMEAAPPDVHFTIACPRERPFWERYAQLAGIDNLIEIPHRKFRPLPLVRLALEVRRRGIAVIHSHGKGAGVYSRALRLLTQRPVVHTFHGLHTGAYGRVATAAYLTLERMLARLTCCAIAVSAGEAAQLWRAGLQRHLRIIINGVPIPAAASKPAAAPPHRVVMMTRYDHQKHAELVIDIAEVLRRRGALDEFRFELLGTGPGAAAFAESLRARGLDTAVRLLGAVDDPERCLEGAFAYLSTSRWEGMPLAVLEAMAHGIPVVATDVVGNHDAVTHRHTGFLYDAAEAGAAADGLQALAQDHGVRSRMAGNARATAEKRYSADRMSDETVACYRALLKQHAGNAEAVLGCSRP
jgi:glycosyltransferase involved in cell wall biosynthesis